MSRSSLRLVDYLDHILEAIERISTYCADTDEVGFLSNNMLQDAVIRNFEVIGEASHNILKLNSNFLHEHPDAPLLFAYEMRNALAHGRALGCVGVDDGVFVVGAHAVLSDKASPLWVGVKSLN